MCSVALISAYPGSYLLFDQDGITCVKKIPFMPQETLHYDWRTYKVVVFYTNGKLMLSKANNGVADYIDCKDYSGAMIELNGKRKLCPFAPFFGSYIGMICKENNVPFEEC